MTGLASDQGSADRAAGGQFTAAFAARKIGQDEAARLLTQAQRSLSRSALDTALQTFEQTRLLSWAECLTFARLLHEDGEPATLGR